MRQVLVGDEPGDKGRVRIIKNLTSERALCPVVVMGDP